MKSVSSQGVGRFSAHVKVAQRFCLREELLKGCRKRRHRVGMAVVEEVQFSVSSVWLPPLWLDVNKPGVV